MHHCGPAARRFYRAFYHWTLLTTSTAELQCLAKARQCCHASTQAVPKDGVVTEGATTGTHKFQQVDNARRRSEPQRDGKKDKNKDSRGISDARHAFANPVEERYGSLPDVYRAGEGDTSKPSIHHVSSNKKAMNFQQEKKGAKVATGRDQHETKDSHPPDNIAREAPTDSDLSTHFRSVLRSLTNSVVVVTAKCKPDLLRSTTQSREWTPKQLAQLIRLNELPSSDGACRSRDLEEYARFPEHSAGVTVSSFTSVSMNPHPIVSFNLRVPGRSWNAIKSSGECRVHFLTADVNGIGAGLADIFARPRTHDRSRSKIEKIASRAANSQGARPITDDSWDNSPFLQLINAFSRDQIHMSDRYNDKPPQLSHATAVRASALCTVIPDKCVQVQDHVIVVARVMDLTMARARVEEPKNDLDRHVLGQRSATQSEDSLLAYANGKFRKMGDVLESRDLWATMEDESVEASNVVDTYDHRNNSQSSKIGNVRDAHLIRRQEKTSPAASNYEESTPSTASHTSPHSFVIPSDLKRPYSTLAIPRVGSNASTSVTAHSPLQQQQRAYSSSSTGNSSFSLEAIMSPSITHQTIADFLGWPDDSKPATRLPRTKGLLAQKKHVQWAQRQLERRDGFTLASGRITDPLTEQEIETLEKTIESYTRTIDKTLANIASQDLKLMLDKGPGRIDQARVGWLESVIERGLQVVREDEQTVDVMALQGKLDQRQLKTLKAKLARLGRYLDTELRRLQGTVEDDDED